MVTGGIGVVPFWSGGNFCRVTRGNKAAEEAFLSLTGGPALYSEVADDYVIDWG